MGRIVYQFEVEHIFAQSLWNNTTFRTLLNKGRGPCRHGGCLVRSGFVDRSAGCKRVFPSGALAEALGAAGLAKVFGLRRCRLADRAEMDAQRARVAG